MKRIKLLFLITFLLLASSLVADANNKEQVLFNDFTIWDFYVPRLDTGSKPEKIELHLSNKMLDIMKNAKITITIMKKESLGWYFITAYCPAECGGSWETASGATCHRADWENRYSEPTTCAISRSVHSFNELFYIEEFDRVFISEDTGPGVQGKHLDLFYEDYDSVISFPTGYYEVFSVEYEEVEIYLGDHE